MSQTVLITGATSGIGRHAAVELARSGYHVIATGRNEAALAELTTELEGHRLSTQRLDVTDQASIDALAASVDELTSGTGPDVIVNNAGIGVAGCMYDVPVEQLRFQFETNVFGLMAVTRAFLPQMMRRGSGRIINVSSIAGRTKVPFMGAYHASKHAVEAISDALRLELRPFGIKVSIIEPGPIATDIPNRVRKDFEAIATPESPYHKVYLGMESQFEKFNKRAVSPEHTTRAIRDAIENSSPKARYVVPWFHIFSILALAHIPTKLADWFICTFTGLRKSKVNPPA